MELVHVRSVVDREGAAAGRAGRGIIGSGTGDCAAKKTYSRYNYAKVFWNTDYNSLVSAFITCIFICYMTSKICGNKIITFIQNELEWW